MRQTLPYYATSIFTVVAKNRVIRNCIIMHLTGRLLVRDTLIALLYDQQQTWNETRRRRDLKMRRARKK